jgi:zinc/manganese transport system permease protein
MSNFLAPVFQTGFFTSSSVHTALIVGAVVAVVVGPLGLFTVMRGQSFAGESLGDIGTTGGSAASLAGVGPLWGFLVVNVVAAAAMELIGIQRTRGRDLATGIVLGASLGLAALFLYLDTTVHNTTGAAVTILFGSLFAISTSTIPLVLTLAVVVLGALLLIHRPLLLSTINPDLAAARGIPVRIVGASYLLALAVSVALCAITVGSLLSTALLIGPAAAALRITKRPAMAAMIASLVGLFGTFVGIVLAYDSFDWPPHEHGWPISFFITCVVFLLYLCSGVPAWRERRSAQTIRSRRIESAGGPDIQLES